MAICQSLKKYNFINLKLKTETKMRSNVINLSQLQEGRHSLYIAGGLRLTIDIFDDFDHPDYSITSSWEELSGWYEKDGFVSFHDPTKIESEISDFIGQGNSILGYLADNGIEWEGITFHFFGGRREYRRFLSPKASRKIRSLIRNA